MYTSLAVVTPPTTEVPTFSLVRQHLRIDSQNDDTLLAMYLTSARTWAESFLGRALITQTLLYTMRRDHRDGVHNGWFWGRRRESIELPRSPVSSISSINLVDDNGATFSVISANYLADTTLDPGRVRIDWDATNTANPLMAWPLQHVQIQFVAGYDATGDKVPMPIQNAILLLTAFLYEKRGDAGGEMPQAAERLLTMHRLQFV